MKLRSIRKKSVVCRLSSVIRSRTSALRPLTSGSAFTLIELLVAMAILMIIVLMLANLFQASTRSWDFGMRQAEVGLEARAAINIIEQDLSQAVCPSNIAAFNAYNFDVLTDSTTNGLATEKVMYDGTSGTKVTRSVGGGVAVELLRASGVDFQLIPQWLDNSRVGLPDYVDISLKMTSSKEYSEVRVYVQGHGYDEQDIDLTDVIDTSRGN